MAKLAYGQKDGKGLSYSRLLTAHSCPRKFQIENIFNAANDKTNVHFAFGHAVAAGVQQLVAEPGNLNKAVVACFAAWDIAIHESLDSKKKSLVYAVQAVKQFHVLVSNPATSLLRKYEIAVFPDHTGTLIPAIELTFCIKCHDGYTYEGHIDLVLKERGTNKYLVLELKTTSFTNIHEAMYKNSAQALGYSIVLDSISNVLGATNSYYVLYLIYKAGALEYETMLFPKNRVQRAKFINSLILDIEVLELYRLTGIYPTRGESCYEFFSPCDYFGLCDYDDEALTRVLGVGTDTHVETFDTIQQFNFTFELDDIKQHQLTAIQQDMITADSTQDPLTVSPLRP